jgi:type II secretory pathway pseudopilin PulG
MKHANPSAVRPTPVREAGFTLVEALVAIVILVFGLIAVTNLLVVAASSNSVANQSTAATAAAAQTMEQLRAVAFNTLVVGGDVNTDAVGFVRDDAIAGVGVIHTRWQIQNVAPVNARALFISVRSEGTGALSRARSRAEFTTIRTCTNIALGC